MEVFWILNSWFKIPDQRLIQIENNFAIPIESVGDDWNALPG